MAETHKLDTTRFHIREATKADIPGIVDVYYNSFNAPFWQYITPRTEVHEKWWHDTMVVSMDNPIDRTFVAEDTQQNNHIVGFSRWVVPQADGNLERKWADMDPKDWDMEVMGAFFDGMEHNREHLMGKRPHWMLELFGVHDDYQKHGIGGELMRWGTDQADRDGLETYLDASEVGQPYYEKRHGFKHGAVVEIPDRPEYGH